MNRRQPYSPPLPQIPADPLRGNLCDPRDPRSHVSPLKGHQKPRATSGSYRALAPIGAGLPSGMVGHHSDAAQPNANSSLLTANWTFTFSAKERDPETGYSYFGSRYYSSDLSIWLSVDPMSGKYPSLSPYAYCANNPVKLVDPNGEDYEVVVEGNTITIRATYYATSEIDSRDAVRGDSNGPTIGLDINNSSVRTAIHEIGHTLGIGDDAYGVMESGGNTEFILDEHIMTSLKC